jgi:hypothetical protein
MAALHLERFLFKYLQNDFRMLGANREGCMHLTKNRSSSLSVLSQQPQGNCALKAEIGCFLPENARFPPILATADAMRPCASNSTRGKPASILP